MKIFFFVSLGAIAQNLPNLFGGNCVIEDQTLIYQNAIDYETGGFSKREYILQNFTNIATLKTGKWIPSYRQISTIRFSPFEIIYHSGFGNLLFSFVAYGVVYPSEINFIKYPDGRHSTGYNKKERQNLSEMVPNLKERAFSTQLEFEEANRYRDILLDKAGLILGRRDRLIFIIHPILQDTQANMSHLITYNTKTGEWGEAKTKGLGPLPKYAFSYYGEGSLIYLTGGLGPKRQENKVKDDVFVLNLDKLEWLSYAIPEFVGTSLGCLAVYENVLIHGFGLTEGNPTNNTQLVSSNKFISKNMLSRDRDSISLTSEYLTLIIVPSLIGLSIIILLVAYFSIHKKITKKHIPDLPNFILEHTWCEKSTDNTTVFNFETSIIDSFVSTIQRPKLLNMELLPSIHKKKTHKKAIPWSKLNNTVDGEKIIITASSADCTLFSYSTGKDF